MHIGKMLIILGIVLIIIGSLWTFIGKLPGDMTFKKGNFSFHFPIMTSIIASVILTLIFYVLSKLGR